MCVCVCVCVYTGASAVEQASLGLSNFSFRSIYTSNITVWLNNKTTAIKIVKSNKNNNLKESFT